MRLFLSSLFLSLLTLFLLLSPPVLAARSTATSFCKCICFNNSTIIALNPPPSSTRSASTNKVLASRTDSNSNNSTTPQKPHHKLTCSDCNRAFCLDYNLPICKDAREEDVFTTCFQRDSIKDEAVVIGFLIATAGLLGWAVIKPWFDKVREARYSVLPSTPTLGAGASVGGRRGMTRQQARDGEEAQGLREDG